MTEANTEDTRAMLGADVKALVDWATPPTVMDLKTITEDADIEHNRFLSNVSRWDDNLKIVGSAAVKVRDGRSKVAPKLIRKQAEWRYPALTEPFLSTPDLFNISPQSAGDRKRAIQNQLVLNNQFNTKLNKVHFIDSYIREAVDVGTVIVKVTWESETEEVIEIVPEYEFEVVNSSADPAAAQQLFMRYQQLLQLRQAGDETYTDYQTPGLDICLDKLMNEQVLCVAHEIGEREERVTKEVKNQPLLEICDVENLRWDPSCKGDYTKAGFAIETFKSCLADLKKDKRYFNLDKINVSTASPLNSTEYKEGLDNESFNFKDSARTQFVVHTYWGTWDIDGTDIVQPIVASWVGNVMIRLELNPYPDKKIPFIMATYMPVRKSIYGEPDGELLEDNQKIVGAVTRGMIDLLGRSANSQTATRKDMLDVTNRRKFERGEDYEFNTTTDPRQGIHTHVYPEIPQSAYNMVLMQNNEAEAISGVKAFHAGLSGQGLGNTATAVKGVLDATSQRELGILRRLADGVIDIGRKIISMNAAFLSEEEVIRVTAFDHVKVRRDDLAGNFDLTLSISTAAEDNQKAQELAFMLQTMTKDSDPGLYKMILSDIARLRKMPDLAKRIEEYQPQPDPLKVAEQELKVKLLEVQIAKEQALTAKHQSEANLSQARSTKEVSQAGLNINKSQTEKAKTRQLLSTADKQDLEYVEQESGVQQERELQKINTKNEKKKEDTQPENIIQPISPIA